MPLGISKYVAARLTLFAAVAYAAVVTSDVRLAGVPVKLFLLAGCLLMWVIDSAADRRRPSPQLAVPVLVVAVGVPIAWFAVAAARHSAGDPAQRQGIHYAVTEASHFLYLLLFFPLTDYLRRPSRTDPHAVWLWPVLVTCGLTVGLWLLWSLTGFNYGAHPVSALRGTIGVETSGDYRIELVTQVLIIPATALMLARIEAARLSVAKAAVLALLMAAAYMAHTRGYWLGLAVVAGALMGLTLAWPRLPRVRALVIPAVCLAVAVSQIVLVSSHVSAHSGEQVSIAQREAQAVELSRGIDRHIVLGSGLGASLPDGYVRSRSDPWSFELTYLQLAFELGVVGLCAVLAVPATILWRLGRRLADLSSRRLLDARVAISATLGLLCTDATNPYLINSAGFLGLAIVAALAERAVADDPAPAAKRSWSAGIAAPRRLAGAARRRWRDRGRSRLATRYLHGTGLEIGALHLPLRLPRRLSVRYVDRLPVDELRRVYPELAGEKLVTPDIIADGERLEPVPDSSVDFVVANHFIEHCEDPIGALLAFARVLRPGGTVYLAVPNKRRTFDRERPLTSYLHLARDHRHGPAGSRSSHYREWARLVDRVSDREVVEHAACLENDNYSIHFHVWTPPSFVEFLMLAAADFDLGLRLVTVVHRGHEFIVIMRREAPQPADAPVAAR